jgi:hypothetical protein
MHRRSRTGLTRSTRYGQEKGPHLAGVVSAGIVTQSGQTLLSHWQGNAQRAFCNATGMAHPVTKSLGQRGEGDRFDDSRQDPTSRSQVTEKAACPGPMGGVATWKTMPTPTGGKMTRKRVDELVIDVVDGNPLLRCPMTEMRGSPEEQLSGSLFVAGRMQALGEIIQVIANGTLPQLASMGLTLNVELQHWNLLWNGLVNSPNKVP